MFEKFKSLFGGKKVDKPVKPKPVVEAPKVEKPKKPRKSKSKKVETELSPKELATLNNEPYINIIKVELDPANINNGSFELDYNDKFVLNLIKSGYKQRDDDTDQIIVDRWFQTVCRNIALELYEQQQADPEKRNDIRVIQSRDLGNGRTEIS